MLLRLEPPAFADADVFLRGVLGRRLRRVLVTGWDGVGALLGAGAEEVLGAAVGDVGFGGGAEGVGLAQGGGEVAEVEGGRGS